MELYRNAVSHRLEGERGCIRSIFRHFHHDGVVLVGGEAYARLVVNIRLVTNGGIEDDSFAADARNANVEHSGS